MKTKAQHHKTASIIVQRANVDINIIPLVKWFNKQSGVYTQFSCEGDYDKNCYIIDGAMILIYVANRDAIYAAFEKLSKAIKGIYLESLHDNHSLGMRYVIRFEGRHVRDKANTWCKKQLKMGTNTSRRSDLVVSSV